MLLLLFFFFLGVFKAFENGVLSAGYHPTPNIRTPGIKDSRIPRIPWIVHLAPISQRSRLSRTLTLRGTVERCTGEPLFGPCDSFHY